MCGSMADIQSATAKIRRGKKERRKKEEEKRRNHRATIKIVARYSVFPSAMCTPTRTATTVISCWLTFTSHEIDWMVRNPPHNTTMYQAAHELTDPWIIWHGYAHGLDISLVLRRCITTIYNLITFCVRTRSSIFSVHGRLVWKWKEM